MLETERDNDVKQLSVTFEQLTEPERGHGQSGDGANLGWRPPNRSHRAKERHVLVEE